MLYERDKLEAKYIREAQLGFGNGGFVGFKFSYYSFLSFFLLFNTHLSN